MQDVGPVHQQASRRSYGGNLELGQFPKRNVQGRERYIPARGEREDSRGPVVHGDIGEKDERRQLLVTAVDAWDHQAVASVVTVEGLVVVGSAAVLGPQFDLVQVEVHSSEIALGRVDQVGVEGEAVEVPRPVGELPDAGELVPGILGVSRRIGEELIGIRKVEGQRRRAAANSPGLRNPSTRQNPLPRTSSNALSGHPHDAQSVPVASLVSAAGPRTLTGARRPIRHGRSGLSGITGGSSPTLSCPGGVGPGRRDAGGICGSDLHMFAHNTGPSPTSDLWGRSRSCLVMRSSAALSRSGPSAPTGRDSGRRRPVHSCAARGIDPLCANCAVAGLPRASISTAES